MTRSTLPRPLVGLLAILPIAVVATGVLAAIPWLKTLPDTLALTITISASIFVMGWAMFIASLARRRQDEVQRHSERVGLAYGFIGGTVFVNLLLLVPPFHDFVVDAANTVAVELKGDPSKSPMLAYVGGVASVVVAQSIGAVIAGQYWWRSRS